MSWTTVWRIFFIAWISFIPKGIIAQNAEETWHLANHYIGQSDYETALSTFQRYLFFKEDRDFFDGAYQIAECYLKLDNFDQATAWYDYAYQLTLEESKRVDISLKKSFLYLQSNNPQFSLIELYSLSDTISPEHLKRKYYYLAATYIFIEEYSKAEKTLSKLYTLHNREDDFHLMKNILADSIRVKRVKPWLAGTMSLIIPGSGQLYAGYPKEAANSFILVGLLEVAFLYVAVQYSLLNAYTSIFPWLQRYYAGGFVSARKLAYRNQEARKNELYQSVLLEAHKLSE